MCSRVLRRRLRGALAQAPRPSLIAGDGKHWTFTPLSLDLADDQRIHDMKHYLCSELSHLSMRHKLRGLTLLEDALDYDDLPENSEAALLAALTPLITREKFLLRKRAIEALTALARRRPGGRLHCPAPALVAAWRHCRTARRTQCSA